MSSSPESCPAELPNWCAQRHWGIFWILILVSVAVVAARVISLGSTADNPRGQGQLPFFSANDRSRWITVRALVDHGTFEVDGVINSLDGRCWDTIDKVRHVGDDGKFHFYSSKPPLLSVVAAGGYYALKLLLGWEIVENTSLVARTLLLLINVSLWAVYLWFVARMINTVPVRDWARYFVLGSAGFGTYLSTFAITLNNHLPAAVFAMMSLYFVSEIVRRSAAGWKWFAAAGLFSALAVAFELPALALLALVAVISAWRSTVRTITAFLPAAALVAAVVLACNGWAWRELIPAYGHRSDGPVLLTVTGDLDDQLNRGELPSEIRGRIPSSVRFVDIIVEPGKWPGTPKNIKRWVLRDLDPQSVAQLAIVSARTNAADDERPSTQSGRNEYQLRQWNNWYDYPGSYWLSDAEKKSPIDRGQPDATLYTFHLLFGHHGLFSLTPLWFLGFAGMVALIGGVKMGGRFQMRWLGWLALTVTVVVIAFYVARPAIDRNYGGVSCTARWLLWLAPLWLMTMLPMVDWLGGSPRGRAICYLLLLVSSVSALLHANNPWTYPWLYQLWNWTRLPV
jgi:hypothetical protein